MAATRSIAFDSSVTSSTVTSSIATSPTALSARRTLAASFTQRGVGLHSGLPSQVTVKPAALGSGRWFRRVDLPGQLQVPATLAAVQPTQLSTELVVGEARVRTVEHLLAALVAMGVDDAEIEVDAPELPLLDGSARDWAEAIAQVGLSEVGHQLDSDHQRDPAPSQPELISDRCLTEPFTLAQGDAFVTALPADRLRFTYGIDFPQGAIGNQWHSLELTPDSFRRDIAPARTFGFADQIAQLQARGLIQGGSLDNALVCEGDRWINPPLRFANEPARHKLLDLVGDLSLLGRLPRAHYLAYKASHSLHTQFAQQLESRLCLTQL